MGRGLINGLAGAADVFLASTAQREKRWGDEDLLAEKNRLTIESEKRIEAASIRGKQYDAAADTQRRGLINQESVAQEELKFNRDNDPNRVKIGNETAKAKTTAAAETAREQKLLDARFYTTPEMLAAEKKLSDAKESPSAKAQAAATWFKLTNDKKHAKLQDDYAAAIDRGDTAGAEKVKRTLDAYSTASSKPIDQAGLQSVMKETADRINDINKAMELNPDDPGLKRDLQRNSEIFAAVQTELTKKLPARKVDGGEVKIRYDAQGNAFTKGANGEAVPYAPNAAKEVSAGNSAPQAAPRRASTTVTPEADSVRAEALARRRAEIADRENKLGVKRAESRQPIINQPTYREQQLAEKNRN